MKTALRWRLATFLSALAVTALASASSASAQGTTQVASSAREWWPSTQEHVRSAPVALRARDDQKLASWYVEHLGFQIAGRVAAVRGGGAQTPETTIYHQGVVLQVQTAKAKAPQRLTIAVRDLPAQLQALEKAGITIQAQGARSAQLRDPEGNLIQLVDDGTHPQALARNR